LGKKHDKEEQRTTKVTKLPNMYQAVAVASKATAPMAQAEKEHVRPLRAQPAGEIARCE
jgi:hypothetical protein